MRTVQEYLREANNDQLISYYLYKYPIKLSEITDEDVTVGQLRNAAKCALADYIDRLRNLENKQAEDRQDYVLFAHKCYRGYEEVSGSLVCLDEIMTKGLDAARYSYIWDYQETIMTFFVADTEYTQKHLIELLTDVLYKASYWGFRQERMEQMHRELEAALEEAEKEDAISYDVEMVFADLGVEPRDEKEKELHYVITRAEHEYNQYLVRKELQALIEILSGENSGWCQMESIGVDCVDDIGRGNDQ